jgi:hypothetical protein
MVTTEHDGQRTLGQRLVDLLVELLTDLGNVLDVFLPGVALRLCLGNRGCEVAFVDDGAADAGQALAESCDSDGRRAHVDAAPAAAQVERHSMHVNRPGLHPAIL